MPNSGPGWRHLISAVPFAGAALETRLGSLGWLVVAWCFPWVCMLMPVHAAGPPDTLEVTQAMTAPAKGGEKKALPQAFPMEEFLDRLMAAESGGRLDAKNPRSTALGPFDSLNPHSSSQANGRIGADEKGKAHVDPWSPAGPRS